MASGEVINLSWNHVIIKRILIGGVPTKVREGRKKVKWVDS